MSDLGSLANAQLVRHIQAGARQGNNLGDVLGSRNFALNRPLALSGLLRGIGGVTLDQAVRTSI
jgi:hypothetical protein